MRSAMATAFMLVHAVLAEDGSHNVPTGQENIRAVEQPASSISFIAGVAESSRASADNAHNGASVPMTLTFSYNGIPAWHPSLSGTLQNFPARYLPGKFQIATPNDFRFPSNGMVIYDCPPVSAGIGSCDVVVFLYECFPCPSKKGGLPKYLLQNGYERTRCAPTFTTKPGGYQQRMSAYIKTIPAGTKEYIVMPGEGKVEFVAFGMSNGFARECSTYNDLSSCEGTDGHCTWNLLTDPKCKLATCTQQGPGGCDPTKCAHLEVPAHYY